VVIDAESLGFGCSSRNGGQVSPSIKDSYDALARSHGAEAAFAIRKTGFLALDYIEQFIQSEQIDCDWRRVGRFHGAYHAANYERMARSLEQQPAGIERQGHVVPRAEQHSEIGTDLYHGGVVYPEDASVDPGKYHQGLLDCVRRAGATLVSNCPVQRIDRCLDGFLVTTPRGTVNARDVVIATNGYSGPLSPWHQRRVIPIGSYMISTDVVAPELMAELCPKSRVLSDSRRLVFYYRPSPDGRRILFGGRVALRETNPRVSGPRLHQEMCRIFPQLADVKISHSWLGFVAYTFDTLPHVGVNDGVHYAMGYCGSGVSLSSYFGMVIGQKILGGVQGDTALDKIEFQTRPLYTGVPWFLAPSVFVYRLRDKFNI
jgi:glycine/D-amino acid oxidase-like deaminating enzyme